ncbi:MAG: hypothetical protein ETSY2_08680 [Candidatus Entotheonella gemina]|uniref:Uncharacterized protein n=1 Tax=Candidatus Entotheonella gemina TaxID=1429439 RepID=W4MD76_9BACT|nr:MAG: hypothetical protein ETSY2_08680 [Candidatus Entotheonella gemina]
MIVLIEREWDHKARQKVIVVVGIGDQHIE